MPEPWSVELAVIVLITLGAGWLLGMMTAACVDARRSVTASRCTGVTAAWCPIHGDYTCPEGDDGLPTLDAETCPLHDPLGVHGDWYDDAR